MKEKLRQYIDLLFAGADNCEDIKLEILQNTLDRYEDLIADGRSPEAAYRQSIAGIGDIGALISDVSGPSDPMPVAHAIPSDPLCVVPEHPSPVQKPVIRYHPEDTDPPVFREKYESDPSADSPPSDYRNLLRTVAPYILSPVLFLLLGLVVGFLFLSIIAVTALLLFFASKKKTPDNPSSSGDHNGRDGRLKVDIAFLGITLYLVISYLTGDWLISMLMLPISIALYQLLFAILDFKEACDHEI